MIPKPTHVSGQTLVYVASSVIPIGTYFRLYLQLVVCVIDGGTEVDMLDRRGWKGSLPYGCTFVLLTP